MSLPLPNTVGFPATKDFDVGTLHLGRAFKSKREAKKHAEKIRGDTTTFLGDTDRKYARVVKGKYQTQEGMKDAYAVYVGNEINPDQ